jgi:hypothetical protein
VSGNAIIACYPDMCAALQARGVMAGRLMPLKDGAASPLGAGVMVTSPSVRGQLADEYAPALIASFGSGDARIDVRAAEPGGAASYQAALRADLASRRSAGSQLLRNWRIRFTARDAAGALLTSAGFAGLRRGRRVKGRTESRPRMAG